MADANMVDFYDRAMRLQKMHRKGLVHEAAGTLGRKALPQEHNGRGAWALPALAVVMLAFVFKAVLLTSIGAESYQARVDGLMAGQDFDRVGGWLMQVDPVTGWIAGQIEGL